MIGSATFSGVFAQFPRLLKVSQPRQRQLRCGLCVNLWCEPRGAGSAPILFTCSKQASPAGVLELFQGLVDEAFKLSH